VFGVSWCPLPQGCGQGPELRDKAVLLGACGSEVMGVEVLWVLFLDGAKGFPHLDHVVQGLVQVFLTVGLPSLSDVFWDVYSFDDVFHAVSVLIELSQECC
jgi:hypothetical protein